MKFTIGLILLFLGVATALEDSKPLEYGMYDYHRRIGIPEAMRIRKLESEIQKIHENRVVGGSSTTIRSVPYQAGLLITIGLVSTSMCGGAIISDTRIITGAHCYNDGVNIARSFTVVLGSNFLFTGGTRINSANVVLYPGYNPRIIANDIAVIRLPNTLAFSPTIQPINLPSGSEINSNYDGSTALASGYGITRDGEQVSLTQTISSVNLRVISNAECANVYGNLILSSHLCTSGAGGVGVCSGDTGGPLVATVNTRRILIGLGSFVSAAGCQAGLPSGFTRVTSFIRWIHSI